MDEYLRGPQAFLLARERASLLDRLGPIRERLRTLFGDGEADVQPAEALVFEGLVVSETVLQIETALQARPRG